MLASLSRDDAGVPRISEFLGIIIYMYWDDGSHATPHLHAERGDHEASFSVNGDLLAGSLPAMRYAS